MLDSRYVIRFLGSDGCPKQQMLSDILMEARKFVLGIAPINFHHLANEFSWKAEKGERVFLL